MICAAGNDFHKTERGLNGCVTCMNLVCSVVEEVPFNLQNGRPKNNGPRSSSVSSPERIIVKVHYYILTYHYRHFHCLSDKSTGVILPPLVGPIGRPPKDGNQQLKTINTMVVVGLNSTIVWNAELTGIGIMAASPTRPFGVPAVVNLA